MIDHELRHHDPRPHWDPEAPGPPPNISPGDVAGLTLGALGVLARHAAHRAGTRCVCNVRVRLVSDPAAMPDVTIPASLGVPEVAFVGLDAERGAAHAVADTSAAIEDLVKVGPLTVQTVHRLLSRIHHHFGEAESRYTTDRSPREGPAHALLPRSTLVRVGRQQRGGDHRLSGPCVTLLSAVPPTRSQGCTRELVPGPGMAWPRRHDRGQRSTGAFAIQCRPGGRAATSCPCPPACLITS